MKLSRPKQVTWLVALVIGVVGILAHLGIIPLFAINAFWLVTAAFVLLVLATLLKGL